MHRRTGDGSTNLPTIKNPATNLIRNAPGGPDMANLRNWPEVVIIILIAARR